MQCLACVSVFINQSSLTGSYSEKQGLFASCIHIQDNYNLKKKIEKKKHFGQTLV